MKKLKEKIHDYIIYPRATKQEESNQLNQSLFQFSQARQLSLYIFFLATKLTVLRFEGTDGHEFKYF